VSSSGEEEEDKEEVEEKSLLSSSSAPIDLTREEEEKEEEEEEEPNAPSIASLLQPLTNACFYRFEGWWTYEFCFKKHVRQYHVESNAKVSVDYSLGKFNEALTNKTRDDENETEIKKREASVGIPATAFHVHHFTDGTECDIGSLETRKTEVHFVCAEDGQNTVLSVKEPTTCSYNLQFATPLLCSHEAFVTKEKNIEPIRCYAYKNEKEDERTFQEILLDAGNYDEEDINSKNSERENSDGHGKNDEL
jgi:protein OS-9